MKIFFYTFLLASLRFASEASVLPHFSQTPCAIAYTPDSVLQKVLPDSAYYHDSERSRVSTCTGVCWMNDNRHLISISLESSSIQIYAFQPADNTLEFIQHLDNSHGMDLARPSNGAIARDSNLLAIGNLAGKTNIYFIDSDSTIDPAPLLSINTHMAHGVQFSKDNRFLAVASLSNGLDIFSFTNPPQLIQSLGRPFAPLRSKSIDFSLDERFAVIGFCHMLTNQTSPKEYGMIAVYRFNNKTGCLDPKPLYQTDQIDSVETLVFHPDGTSFFVVDQAHDRIIGIEFDIHTGQIGEVRTVLEGTQSGLCFPHGLSFTSDGKFAAVSNHGDDKVTIYRLTQSLN